MYYISYNLDIYFYEILPFWFKLKRMIYNKREKTNESKGLTIIFTVI